MGKIVTDRPDLPEVLAHLPPPRRRNDPPRPAPPTLNHAALRSDAEGDLDGFRETSTIRWRGLGSALLPKPDSCHDLTFSPVLVVLVPALVGAVWLLLLVRVVQTAATWGQVRTRGAGGVRRAAKPRARAARLQRQPQRKAAPGNNCPPLVAKRVPPLITRKSLQFCTSSHSAGRHAGRRRCAVEAVQEVLTDAVDSCMCCPA